MDYGTINGYELREGPVPVRVEADFACFSDPNGGAESVSYPVMPPSAAIGIVACIYSHPEARIVIRKIDVLKPIQYDKPYTFNGVLTNSPNKHTQKTFLCLKDVAYNIWVQFLPYNGDNTIEDKHRAMFFKRIMRGECHTQPHAGTLKGRTTLEFGPRNQNEATHGIPYTEFKFYVLNVNKRIKTENERRKAMLENRKVIRAEVHDGTIYFNNDVWEINNA